MFSLKKAALHLVCLLTILGQATAPVAGHAMTIGEERKIGEKLKFAVRGEFRILDHPDISQYINRLGHQVLGVAGPQYFDYRFYVVKSDQFNAFAAPAGLVFFYTGLIESMKTEDELISVLAHEIGHVVSRHIAQRSEKGGKVNTAAMVLGLASLALGIPALSQGLLTGSLAAGQAVNLHYSRVDEEQSDRLSFDWMKEMHRNPEAMEDMLRTMRRITRYRSGKLPQYLLTHPNPEFRLDYVQSLMAIDSGQREQGYYPQTDNFEFYRFKYRVMAQTVDPENLRVHCANVIASGKDKTKVVLANFGLSLLAFQERDYDKALNYLDKVVLGYPDRKILEIDRAVILSAAGRIDESTRLLRKAVHRDPTDMYSMYELAKVVQKKGDLQEAKGLFLKVAKVMPEYAQIYYDLGRVQADLNKENISQFYLGKHYLYEGRIKTAKQYLKKASKDTTLPQSYRSEAESILDRLKELEKEN